jgi:hypothetical protein
VSENTVLSAAVHHYLVMHFIPLMAVMDIVSPIATVTHSVVVYFTV